MEFIAGWLGRDIPNMREEANQNRLPADSSLWGGIAALCL